MITILANVGPTALVKRWYEDGVQVDAGAVTVGIDDAAGNEVVAAGTATSKAGTGTTTTYTYQLAIQATLNLLTATWTRTDTGAALQDQVEVVGGHLFTVADALGFKDRVGASIPVADIISHRDDITNLFQDVCRRSFVPKYGREVVTFNDSGVAWTGWPDLTLVRSLADRYGTAWDLATLETTTAGRLYLPGMTPGQATVEYEHGLTRVPAAIKRAALIYLMNLAAGSDLLDRAIVHTDETGTYRLQQPDATHATGIPEVDTALAQYTYIWGVA